MDQPLKSPGQSALEDAFHAMFELSRTRPAPDLAGRLDRLAHHRQTEAGGYESQRARGAVGFLNHQGNEAFALAYFPPPFVVGWTQPV